VRTTLLGRNPETLCRTEHEGYSNAAGASEAMRPKARCGEHRQDGLRPPFGHARRSPTCGRATDKGVWGTHAMTVPWPPQRGARCARQSVSDEPSVHRPPPRRSVNARTGLYVRVAYSAGVAGAQTASGGCAEGLSRAGQGQGFRRGDGGRQGHSKRAGKGDCGARRESRACRMRADARQIC
jgi:hypothetical protein